MGLKLREDMPEQAIEVASVLFRSPTPADEAYVDAFPSDVVIFTRNLKFLRGLSSTMNVDRIAYLEIMRPFAESVILRYGLLLMNLDNIFNFYFKVCAYKNGKVIIDTAAGVLGRYDPRPVQPDSLFTLFSATKPVVAGMVHWLVENGKLKLEENVSNIWPEFIGNGKEHVHHVLNHTAGLHNALAYHISENPLLLSEFDECLELMEASESRLASLTLDTDDLNRKPELKTTFQINNLAEFTTSLPAFFNMLNIRRGFIPGINGHCSARALARYYAALADRSPIPLFQIHHFMMGIRVWVEQQAFVISKTVLLLE
ncbi:hypothetical protein PTKIN_Ptkin18bG0046000 [Pterospermum kingtungense]